MKKKEIAVISEFLPKQLNDDETKKLCEDIIKSLKASSMKDMGKVMGTLKAKHGDVLDFSKTSQILKNTANKMMKYPKEYLEEIKTRLKVSQVVGKYVQLKKERERICRTFSF